MRRNFVLAMLLMFGVTNVFATPLTVDVHTRNFTNQDKVKLEQAVKLLEAVMNSEEFYQEVMNFKFNTQDDEGMTNQEIYDLLMTGAEVLSGEVDYVMNFDLTMYRSKNPFSKVKGYTKPGTNRIWIHSKFYRRKSWTPIDVAANLAHEWTHKMGFGHDYKYTSIRPTSVPYGIGSIVSKVATMLKTK